MELPNLIRLLAVIVVLGVVVYLVENFLPMAQPFKIIFRVIVILAVCLYLLRVFGVM